MYIQNHLGILLKYTHSESVGWCLKFSISKKLPNNINAAGSTDHNLSSKVLEENGFQDVELKKKKEKKWPQIPQQRHQEK